MKKIFLLISLITMLTLPSVARRRAAEEQPIVTLHSSAFMQGGAANKFHLLIGGTAGEYIDVDCGFGPVEVELKPAMVQNGAMQGTVVTCTVSAEGMVRIYGNAADIDYFEAEGCYLRSADLSQLTNLAGVNLQHNELTGLDLTPNTKLQTIQVGDNPFSKETPLVIGGPKPGLMLLEMAITEWLDPNFNLSDYPALVSFDAFSCATLDKLDPTGCPNLQRITVDVTPLETIDVTRNPKLEILNVADTKVRTLDVSENPKLTQLYCNHDSFKYSDYKLTSLDVTKNPMLVYLFCAGNSLIELDLTHNPLLMDLSAARNHLTDIDLSTNEYLINVNIAGNDMGWAQLPINPGTWNEYYYKQRPTKVKRSYKVGDVIDLSAKMLREGTITIGKLMLKNDEDFSNPIPVDPALYSYADGKMTLLAALPDSVFVQYANDRFPDETLATTHFMVKTPEEYGTSNVVLAMDPGVDEGGVVSFKYRYVVEEGDNCIVKPQYDMGNGTFEFIEATVENSTGYTEVSAPRTGSGAVRVMLPEDVEVTGLRIEGMALTSIDLSGAPQLRELTLTGTGLFNLDLSKHRCLQTLKLEGNYLTNFSIAGKNMNYAKTTLQRVEIAGNNIATFEFDGLESVKYFDISRNNLKELELGSATGAEYINISSNKLTEVNMAKLDAIQTINMAHNDIASITMPEVTVPQSIDISDNCMTIATLPLPKYFPGTYTYAPQKPLPIPAKGPGVDLSSQLSDIDGVTSTYKWYKSNNTALEEGTDYSIVNGVTRFINSEVGEVYCKISHPVFPAFTGIRAFKTTKMKVTPMPTNLVATFSTLKAGEDVRVALAAGADNTSIFFDWKGDGNQLSMYEVGTTYSEFFEKTRGKYTVRVYTYDEAPITVFSVSGASMGSADLSRLTEASTINLTKAGLEKLTLPPAGHLAELFLEGNKLGNDFDLSAYKELYYLVLSDNQLSGEYDFSVLPNLQLLSAANNALTSVKLGNKVWALDLSRNDFETIDLSTSPDLEQVGLSGNRLSSLDVSKLTNLKSLYIDQNRFTFSTLPSTEAVSVRYVYRNQAELEVEPNGMSIDLSAEAKVGDSETTYRWFFDEVTEDTEGNWVGEELIAGEEYTVSDGVTTFNQKSQRVIGLLTNPAFPQLALRTKMTDVVPSVAPVVDAPTAAVWSDNGALYATADTDGAVAEVYTVSGVRLAKTVLHPGINALGTYSPGIYVVSLDGTTHKVAIR